MESNPLLIEPSASQAAKALAALLTPTLAAVVDAVFDESYVVSIPEAEALDTYTAEELASLVARSSNVAGRCARLAGMARAYVKLTKGTYERSFKRARGSSTAKNEAAREAYAMEVATSEHEAWVLAESIAELADSLELGARLASESSRKLLGSLHTMAVTGTREHAGAYTEADFNSLFS